MPLPAFDRPGRAPIDRPGRGSPTDRLALPGMPTGVRMRIGDTEAPRTEPRGTLMSQATIAPPEIPQTMADLWERLGRIPLERIRLRPAPGTATENDVIRDRTNERTGSASWSTAPWWRKPWDRGSRTWPGCSATCIKFVSRSERPGDLPRCRRHDADRPRAGANPRPVIHLVGQAPGGGSSPRSRSPTWSPTWPSRSSARGTPRRRCGARWANTSTPGSGWSG